MRYRGVELTGLPTGRLRFLLRKVQSVRNTLTEPRRYRGSLRKSADEAWTNRGSPSDRHITIT